MKQKLLKTMRLFLVAALLGVGTTSVWAEVTPFSESYSSTSVTTGWSTSVSGRFTPVVLNEGDNYYLSVQQNTRDNNGCIVTGNIISGKADAGDDFTLLFDMRVGSSNDQNPVSVEFKDAANSSIVFSMTATGKNVTTWVVNGTSTQVTLPGSGPNSATDGTAITGITWCTYKITRSGSYTYVTITNKSTDEDILERTIIGGGSATGGLGNIVFTTRRKQANFAIDNIVVREVESGDVPATTPTTCTIKFQDALGNTLKEDAIINTLEGSSVNADDYVANFYANDKKYIYASGNNPITAVADAASNVITLIFSEAGTWTYSIKAIDGESTELKVLATGTQFEGDSKKAFFTKAFKKDATWYETTSGASGASYFSFSLTEGTPSKNVTYSTTSDIDYFFECEDLTVMTKRDGGTSTERASNGAAVRLGVGGYIYTSALSAGTYTIRLNCNNPNSGNPTFDIMLWDGENLTSTGKTIVKNVEKTGDYAEVSTADIVVPEGMALALKNNTAWNSNASLDYIILQRTGDASVSTTLLNTYGTIASAYALDCANLPTGLTAYQVTSIAADKVTLTQVTEAVAAGTGLILKGTGGETYNIPVVASGTDISATNKLNAAVTATDVDANAAYVLYKDEFRKVTNASSVPAGKAYLLATDVPAEARSLTFNFGDATGISAIAKSQEPNANGYYNLAGQRVAQPTKGLYIQDGKKVIIK